MRLTPNAGYTLLARSALPPGSLVLSESPLVMLKESDRQNRPETYIVNVIKTQLDALPKERREGYRSLAKSHKKSGFHELYDVHETNSVKVEIGEEMASAVFWNLSRINHACRPNSAYSFHASPPTIKLHTLRDLEADEELTISYVPWNADFATRQRTLQRDFAFTCTCRLCSSTPDEISDDNERLMTITALRSSLEEWVKGFMSSLQATENVRRMQSLMTQSQVLLGRGIMAGDGALIAMYAGDEEAAKAWGHLSAKWYTIESGEDSEQAVIARTLAEEPWRSSNWKKGKEEKVGGPLELEDW
ncbi:SET domain-containing protein [Atractiella rhizophila]|nr:SET domain-containing protein [Atractiella rhizophila]